MRHIRAFLKFWYVFIVGDDWTIAATVLVASAMTLYLVQSWWLLPMAAIFALGASLWRTVGQGVEPK
jgi:hypothetical protein